jgi:two-component system OmpR family response regulator
MHAGAVRIAVFEDDKELQLLLALVFKAEGYDTVVEASGYQATHVVEAFEPDLAIVDVHLADGCDGLRVARRLREQQTDLPIVFLSSSGSLDDRLAGFEAGGDDYIAKPFSVAEVLARVRAVLRRAGHAKGPTAAFADILVDELGHTVSRAGRAVDLTPTEFDLLRAFVRRPGVVVSKRALLGEIWGFDQFDDNVVEVHMSSLRRKLEQLGPRLIHTVRAVGYVLREPVASENTPSAVAAS